MRRKWRKVTIMIINLKNEIREVNLTIWNIKDIERWWKRKTMNKTNGNKETSQRNKMVKFKKSYTHWLHWLKWIGNFFKKLSIFRQFKWLGCNTNTQRNYMYRFVTVTSRGSSVTSLNEGRQFWRNSATKRKRRKVISMKINNKNRKKRSKQNDLKTKRHG